jgi:hypothetical protein
MALKSDLMAAGFPAGQANKLGLDPSAAVTAAGTTQGTATALAGNNANVTTSSVSAGVKLQATEGSSFVYNTGPNTLTVYPPVGSTILGLAVNAGLTVAAGSGVLCIPNGANIACNISGP